MQTHFGARTGQLGDADDLQHYRVLHKVGVLLLHLFSAFPSPFPGSTCHTTRVFRLPAILYRYVARFTVIDIEKAVGLVHFDRWSKRYDEWIPFGSNRT